MHRLPVLGQLAPVPLPSSSPLRITELGAFKYASKLERRIVQKIGQAVADYELISDGDRIMVCVSGGKDSYALLDALLLLGRKSPVRYELIAVNVDQGWPGYQTDAIEQHLRSREVPYRMVRAHEIAEVVERVLKPEETGATPCSLCSRLRRGVLYGLAQELGATKIALGHHLDDLAETLMLNLFYSGSLRAMPPKLVSDDGRNVVIRPMAFVEEKDLIAYAEERRYPVVRCSCPTCGLPDQQRQVVKRLLSGLQESHPGLKTQMLAAMKNVKVDHLLDRALSAALRANQQAAKESVEDPCTPPPTESSWPTNGS
jgi:tRNA 2-thiocytidine biosynthesis protein TtcA